ncbi:MAG TPA: murein biosynthesis integral membrane protein MurJ [Thermoanaerobaculia bacterium]|nr:murein biosynthesis integral membrane protein MurJ [Thermoanaerobaculia bacterium]
MAASTGGPEAAGSRSGVVALGILLSRLAGLARQRAVAHFFGTSPWADVLVFALRAPNVLQNLLGEGTLSASFIPVYSRMLEEGRREEAGRLAGAVFGLLLALAGGLALLGVLFAEPLVAVLASGFLEDRGTAAVDRFPLAVTAVRITFPMTGVLVLHAWALGVLNSHRRFFLPYFAPVLWNAAILAALVGAGSLWLGDDAGAAGSPAGTLDRLLFAACFGALAGGFLQFLVQVPLVLRVMRGFRVSFSTRVEGVRRTLRAFGPIVAGRGVVQLGAYLDLWLAAFLVEGAIGALGYAQLLYMLPISLFAMSVAAAELPELSRLADASPEAGRRRVERSLGQIAFLVVPTALGYLAFGYLLTGALYRTGSFGVASNVLVYGVLLGYTLGLPASAASRLIQNAFFAHGDTRSPARIAAQRVLVAAVVAVPLMFALDRVAVAEVVPAAGSALRLGALGLALGSAAGAWFELVRLLRGLGRRPDAGVSLPWRPLARMAGLALAAALPAALLWRLLPAALHPALAGLLVIGAYAALYLAGAALARFPELEPWTDRWRRSRRG